MMRIIPVMDLMSGQVVRGIAGNRSRYRPVVSVLAQDATPHSIAQAFAQQLGAREVYVADLDAIAGREPDWDAYEQIASAGLRPLVDAGIGDVVRAQQLADWAAACSSPPGLVVGLESVPDAEHLSAIHRIVASHGGLFSLDLRDGKPATVSGSGQARGSGVATGDATELATRSPARSPARFATRLSGGGSWDSLTARQIADVAVQVGFRRLIVLDLASVGVNQGPVSESLCRELRAAHPEIGLITGGGVRSVVDLQRLARSGCDAALVASALHDGRLTAAHIRQVEQESQSQLGLPSGQSGPSGPSSVQCNGSPRGGPPRLSSTSRS